MQPVLAVRNTFLHVEDSGNGSDSDQEAMESAASHVRSLKRAHTNPSLGTECGDWTPSTGGTDGQEDGPEHLSDDDDQQRRERVTTYDAFGATPQHRDGQEDGEKPLPDEDGDQQRRERATTYDAFEATPQHRDGQEDDEKPLLGDDDDQQHRERTTTYDAFEATPQYLAPRCSSFDAFEGTPRAGDAAWPGSFGSEVRAAAQWPPEAFGAPRPLGQEAGQQPGPQAVAVQGVAAQALAPQALVMAIPMGFQSLGMPAAFVGQQAQPMLQQPQQPPSGPPPAVATRSCAVGQGPLAQQSGQQQLRHCPLAAVDPRAPATDSTAVACVSLPDGGARVLWDLDARRFACNDTTVVSPAFVLDLPGIGAQPFKVVVHAAGARGTGGLGPGFRTARGRSRVELKCDAHVPRPGQDSHAGEEYVIVLDKREGARLGVDLASEEDQPWWVKAVTGGLIEQWNAAHPTCPVAPGDRIISANGVCGSAVQVREQCSKVGALRLVMQRGHAGAPRFWVSFGVGSGGGAFGCEPLVMRGPVLRSFAGQSCCGLPSADGGDEFDLHAAVDRASRTVAIHIDVLPLGHA